MVALNFPQFSFKIADSPKIRTQKVIYDPIRKKMVALTPEEWVRQHAIRFLIDFQAYPTSFLAVETGIQWNNKRHRADIVAYTRTGIPALLVECKAPTVALSQQTLEQIARYNMQLRVPFLWITNGLHHFCYQIADDRKSYQLLEAIPHFDNIACLNSQ